MGRQMTGGDCGERNVGRQMRRDWGQGCHKRDEGEDRDVGRGMRGGDCGEVDEGKRLWGKGYGERDEVKGLGKGIWLVERWMRGRDCGERDTVRGMR